MEGEQTYTGLSLGEKKAVKAAYAANDPVGQQKKLQAALGTDWIFQFDWASIITAMKLKGSGEEKYLGQIYSAWLPAFVKEIEAMDDDVREALNDACKKHVWTLKGGQKGEDYTNGGGRGRIEPLVDGVTLVWNPTSYFFQGTDANYPYSEKFTVTAFVLENC